MTDQQTPAKGAEQKRRFANFATNLAERYSPRLRTINRYSLLAAAVIAVITILTLVQIERTQNHIETINIDHEACQAAVIELSEASDYLTEQARAFVDTGNRVYLDNYIAEVRSSDRRGNAMNALRKRATNDEAVEALELARATSDSLAKTELYAMSLAADARELDHRPGPIASIEFDEEDAKLTKDSKLARAIDLVYGNDYMSSKLIIRDNVDKCSELLIGVLKEDLDQSTARLSALLGAVFISITLMLAVVLFDVLSSALLLLAPMSRFETCIREGLPLVPSGTRELRYLVSAYNDMYEANHSRTESLRFQANNDALTGVLNRGSFETLLTLHKADCALVLVDVDLFKHFNDDYGHEMGDAILVEVSATLYSSFRSTDYVFRIGGDEFAVIATAMNPTMRDTIARKIEAVQEFLRDTSNGLPPCTISVGIAFGSVFHSDDGLFKEADAALYEAKSRGRDGYVFWDDIKDQK